MCLVGRRPALLSPLISPIPSWQVADNFYLIRTKPNPEPDGLLKSYLERYRGQNFSSYKGPKWRNLNVSSPKGIFPLLYLKTPGIGVDFRYSWSKVLKGCHKGLCLQFLFVQFSLSDDSLRMKIPSHSRLTHLKACGRKEGKILTLPVSTVVDSRHLWLGLFGLCDISWAHHCL